MKDLILLSENNDFRYYGVHLPKDASNIDRERTSEGQYYLVYSVPLVIKANVVTKWIDNKFIKVGDKQKIEIIGILSKDSEVSEEVLSELGYSALTVDGKIFTHPSEALEYDLKLKGILIDNPIEKPDRKDKQYNHGYHTQADWFERDMKEWQSHEDRLQKVVLIKVKK